MANKKEVPKYVLRMLEKRRKLAGALMIVNQEITNYCEKIGMDITNPDACLLSDFRIYCEFDGAYSTTLETIHKQLNRED